MFNWMPSVLICMFFLVVDEAIGAFSYLPFILVGIFCYIFLYKYLPETKGRPVDEIVRQWVQEPSNPEKLNLTEHSVVIQEYGL